MRKQIGHRLLTDDWLRSLPSRAIAAETARLIGPGERRSQTLITACLAEEMRVLECDNRFAVRLSPSPDKIRDTAVNINLKMHQRFFLNHVKKT